MGAALLKFLTSSPVTQWATAVLVVVMAGCVGRRAAEGLTSAEWLQGLTLIGTAIAVAVVAWAPLVQKQEDEQA